MQKNLMNASHDQLEEVQHKQALREDTLHAQIKELTAKQTLIIQETNQLGQSLSSIISCTPPAETADEFVAAMVQPTQFDFMDHLCWSAPSTGFPKVSPTRAKLNDEKVII